MSRRQLECFISRSTAESEVDVSETPMFERAVQSVVVVACDVTESSGLPVKLLFQDGWQKAGWPARKSPELDVAAYPVA